jgi:uncharacterized membrane protein
VAALTVGSAVVLLSNVAARRARGEGSTPVFLADAIIGVGAFALGADGLIGNKVAGSLLIVAGVLVIAALIVPGYRRSRQSPR